ncbi:MAG TPA: hypothetical protein VN667_03130 [Burkholderiales bacterium]|nr:hypothetical protein [Burkholderiales bacterium]
MDDLRIPAPAVLPTAPARPIGRQPEKRRERRPSEHDPQAPADERPSRRPGSQIDEYAIARR